MESKDNLFTKPTFELNKSSNKNQIEFVLSSKLASINPKSDIRNLKVKVNGEPNEVVKD